MKGKIFNGYKVVAEIKNKFIVAVNPRACEPWVIWRVDHEGQPYSGEYMCDKRMAINRFRQLGFKGVF